MKIAKGIPSRNTVVIPTDFFKTVSSVLYEIKTGAYSKSYIPDVLEKCIIFFEHNSKTIQNKILMIVW